MNLARRQLLEGPFRRFAEFGGRAGRAEFWMFALVFVVITELAWLVGYGGAALVPANDLKAHPALLPLIRQNRPMITSLHTQRWMKMVPMRLAILW